MLLAFVLIGLAVAQPRSEWMDEFDPESAYLSIISVAKEVDSTLHSTLNEEPKELEEGVDDEEDLPPPPPPPSDLDVDRRKPPGPPGPWPPLPRPEDRCGNWSTWQQSKCWWPDQPLDQLPPACAAIPTKAHWPEWMKKFVVGKAMEKYNMLMDEYKTRGAPPKCGRCSRSFECRMRNEISSRRGFCPSKQIRPMFNVDCEDRRACEVTQEKGGCPPPLFLRGERRQRLQKLIKDGNHEDFAKELWNMRGNDENKRQKRQAESYFNGRFGFMPFSPQFDFPYENGRQGGRSPSENFPQPPIRPSVSSNYGYDSFGPFSDFPGTPFRPGPPGPPRHIPFGPSRDFPRRPIRPGPPGPPPRDQFGPTDDFPLPPFRPRPFGPFPRGPSEPSNDIPMHPFRSGPNSLPGRRLFPHSDDFPTPPFRSGPVDHQGRGSFVSVNDFPQPSFRNGPPGEFGRGYMRPSRYFRRSPFGSGPYGGQQRDGSFRPTDNFPQPNFHRNPFVPQERGPFGPSNDFSPLPFHTFSPFKDQRGFAPNISPATKFSMFWARPMSFPGPIPPRPPVGPPPHHQFLFDIFHGTTCVSSGKKCLCCCGHFIPNVDTGDCEDLRQLLPGIEKMVEQVVQPSHPPPPSEKAMMQTKEFFQKQTKSY